MPTMPTGPLAAWHSAFSSQSADEWVMSSSAYVTSLLSLWAA